MGSQVYKGGKVYTGAYDLSCNINQWSLGVEYAELDATTLCSSARYSVPGIPKVTFDYAGHAEVDGSTESDDVLFTATTGQLALANVPMTFAPLTGAAGEAAYFTKAMTLSSSPIQGDVNSLWDFQVSGVGQGQPLIRGTIFGTGSKTSTGNSSVIELGAATSTQYLYGCLHVIAASGTNPTLDVIVASDDAEGFSSATTRLTFTQATGITSQFITPVAGPITDTHYRATWTIGGTDTPTFSIVLVVGIR